MGMGTLAGRWIMMGLVVAAGGTGITLPAWSAATRR